MNNLLYVSYKILGDISVFNAYNGNASSSLAFIKSQADSAGGLANIPTKYGDWCPPPDTAGRGQGPKPAKPLTSAVQYLMLVDQLLELANVTGDASTVQTLTTLQQSLRTEYNTVFLDSDTTSPTYACFDGCGK